MVTGILSQEIFFPTKNLHITGARLCYPLRFEILVPDCKRYKVIHVEKISTFDEKRKIKGQHETLDLHLKKEKQQGFRIYFEYVHTQQILNKYEGKKVNMYYLNESDCIAKDNLEFITKILCGDGGLCSYKFLYIEK